MLTVAEIRKRFPDPVPAFWIDGLEETERPCSGDPEYCIGGATLMTLSGLTEPDPALSFPAGEVLADALLAENPALDDGEHDYSLDYARRILTCNDANKMEEGWMVVELALMHGRTKGAQGC